LISFLLIESILLLSWNRIYFRFGIPIFVKRIPFFGSLDEPFDAQYLEDNFEGVYVPNIFFRKISSKECAFREKLWNFRIFSYIPVMRGLIRGDEGKKSLCIIGYVNWYVVIFTLYILGSAAFYSFASWTPMLILVALFYVTQAIRFKKVSEFAFEWLKINR
jgi:hypothetical protein